VIKPNGSSTPLHSHDEETELSYVLSGSLGVETEGCRAAVGAGSLVVLPPARPHRLFNDSGRSVREFLLCTPARFDQFVAVVGTPVAPYAEPEAMTEEDRERLVGAAPQFGIRLLPSAAPQNETHEPAPSSPDILDVLGTRIDVLARLGDGDDDLVLLRSALEPGLSVPLHSHADPECLFVIGGELDVYRDDSAAAWNKLGPGEAIYVGSNVRHAIRNGGAVPAELLAVVTVRMARFFAAIGSSAAGPNARLPSSEQRAAFPDQIAAHSYWIATPDENAAAGLPIRT
jgi:quercetin dioxygenase-like cupin family protein